MIDRALVWLFDVLGLLELIAVAAFCTMLAVAICVWAG